MTTPTTTGGVACRRCGAGLTEGARACPACRALVHAKDLRALADAARQAHATGDVRGALEHWRLALNLLPPEASQADWIRGQVRDLELVIAAEQVPGSGARFATGIGVGAALLFLLTKGKVLLLGLLKLPFLGSLFAFFAVYWIQFGAKFALGLTLLILIHELGHYVDIRRRGLPADMPIFLPGLGAYVRWRAQGVSLETRAAVSLAGPIAGLLAAAACAALYYATANPLWAALTRVGAWLNLLNLAPVWVLDGGQAALALTRRQRVMLLVGVAITWAVLQESILFLVLLGAVWSIFAKNAAAQPSPKILSLFLATLVLLAAVMSLMPGHGAALP